MKILLRVLRFVLVVGFAAATAGVLAFAGLYFYLTPTLPSIDELKDIHFQVPLRVFSQDHRLIAEFGEKRRTPVRYDELPPMVIQAFLAAEDDRFFEHPGVDYQGILRAVVELVRTGEKRQGGSTITMQVARNFFLSREKTYLRKAKEIFLALKIERSLTKEEILALYLNKIYLGHRAYGVSAAAQVYYGSSIQDLTLPQIAMIAGLPKAPSRDNPVSNPVRAMARRNYVLARLYELEAIDAETYREALETPDDASIHAQPSEVEAPYVAEMVRAELVERFGPEAYTRGYEVITTIDSRLQEAANQALRHGLLAYERRHGYRGPEAQLELPATDEPEQLAEQWNALLAESAPAGGLFPALVVAIEPQSATVVIPGHGEVTLPWEGLSWARAFRTVNARGPEPKTADEVLAPGDLVRVELRDDGSWWLAQQPAAEGALVSLKPEDGAVVALVGGFDFYRSKFNRAVQGQRQPGSSFKPFIYSAALEKGFTAASVINDAPVVFDDPSLETTWRPENYSGKFYGPTRLREALVRSRNLVSVRLLRAIGIHYAVDYVTRFGFQPEQLPKNLSLALGSGSATPWQMAAAYAVFANGGYRIEPYVLDRILDADGEIVYRHNPLRVCADCEGDATAEGQLPVRLVATTEPSVGPESENQEESHDEGQDALEPPAAEAEPPLRPAPRVIAEDNAYLMASMMRDVIRRGTGRRAMALGRTDLAGKTGTTNDQQDAWFCGFNGVLVTTTWLGHDQVEPLGAGETGGRAALPMWMEYMGYALEGTPPRFPEQPGGLVSVRIDPETGLLPAPGQSSTLFEIFRPDQIPTESRTPVVVVPQGGADGGAPSEEPLF